MQARGRTVSPPARAAVARGARILIVEDEPALLRALQIDLRARGYDVAAASTGREALSEAAQRHPDAVLLDLGLPDIDGTEVVRELRRWSTAPVIVLSGRAGSGDKIGALDAGADDYVTKPFSPRELLARIRTVLRRAKSAPPDTAPRREIRAYRFGEFELNLRTRRLKRQDGRSINLTNGELNLLAALLSAPERILTRDQLLEASRVYDNEVYDRAIDIQVLRLRRKIEEDPANPRYIITERGVGYVFSAPVEVLY